MGGGFDETGRRGDRDLFFKGEDALCLGDDSLFGEDERLEIFFFANGGDGEGKRLEIFFIANGGDGEGERLAVARSGSSIMSRIWSLVAW